MSNDHLKACLAQIAQTNEESLAGFRELSRQTAQVRQSLEDLIARLSKLDVPMADVTTEVVATFRTEFGDALTKVGTRLETRFDRIDQQLQQLIDRTVTDSRT